MRKPQDLTKVTQQLVEAGIAERLLGANTDPNAPKELDGCYFWVQRDDDDRCVVWMDYPPYGDTFTTVVVPGKPFVDDEELSAEQLQLVQELAEEWANEPVPAA